MLCRTLCAVLAALTLGAATADSPGITDGSVVSWAPLGLNTAPWDGAFAGGSSGSADALLPLLRSADVGMLRYGGGSFADNFGWEGGVDVQDCPHGGPDAVAPALGTGGCASPSTLGFGDFSRQAARLGASTFVTVNYGTGTPQEAADWVSAAKQAPEPGVALWEIGNETYGCWEANNWLEQAPTNYAGYVPSTGGQDAARNPTCPQTSLGGAVGTQLMANSYAANALPFMTAMKAANNWAQIGVPWAFGSDVPGASVPRNAEWNDTVLSQDSSSIGFVDAHYYPFTFSGSTGGGNPDDQQVLQALAKIPALYGQIRTTLSALDPKASVIVGETNVSNAETTTVCQPVGALFAAGDVLSWLAAGAQSIDWWNMNNFGNTGSSCGGSDFGMFTSPGTPHSGPGSQPPQPETPYYGYRLASVLVRPGARLAPLPVSGPDSSSVLAFQSALPDGKTAVAFLNTETGRPGHVTFAAPDGLQQNGHALRTWGYSQADPKIVTGTEGAGTLGGGITLSPESLTVLETS